MAVIGRERTDPAAPTGRGKSASAALYLSLATAVSVAAGGAAAAASRLLAPAAAAPFRGALAAAAGAWGLLLLLEAVSSATGRNLLRPLSANARRRALGAIYPACRLAGLAAGRSADAVAASYLAFSNGLEPGGSKGRIRGRLLVILPRCLQREGCARAVTEDVRNCIRCGKCDMAALLPLMERHGFAMAVATGGRLARAMVRDLKPAGVIAVACERELVEGLRGAGGVPVICIPNRRPEGPCRNTSVDMADLEAAVLRLAGAPRGEEASGSPPPGKAASPPR